VYHSGLSGLSALQEPTGITMSDLQPDVQDLHARFKVIESKRESLIQLLEQPNLGTLRIDVNQALEEIDDLIDEFKRTFPNS
jgi:hypothetical protein